MFKLLRNVFVFGFLYAGYKWLIERFSKPQAKDVQAENSASSQAKSDSSQ